MCFALKKKKKEKNPNKSDAFIHFEASTLNTVVMRKLRPCLQSYLKKKFYFSWTHLLIILKLIVNFYQVSNPDLPLTLVFPSVLFNLSLIRQ